MKLCLIICAIFGFSVITLVECQTYYFTTGLGWKNEIRKCSSGGGASSKYLFEIGTLGAVGLKYEDINKLSKVMAFGDLKGHTGAVDNNISSLILKDYQDNGTSKTFVGKWNYQAVSGWAKQKIEIQLTVKFMNNGKVELTNYVYAYSMMAVTCAQTTSYVYEVEVINT